MHIDRGSFLILVSTLAIGTVGGYVASEKHLVPALDRWRGNTPPEPPPPPPVADAAPPVSAPPPPPAPAAPACDDSVATVGACPPPGYPTIEGGCGSFANVRCNELKQSMKPKVAAAAVACLDKLTPRERCDQTRVYLCGHLAFMNACPEVDSTLAVASGDGGAAAPPNAPPNANANVAPAAGTRDGGGARSVSATCQEIIEGCGPSPVAPSMAECRQLLSGMTDLGRERTRTCMKTHCFDRGLVGCEGVTTVK